MGFKANGQCLLFTCPSKIFLAGYNISFKGNLKSDKNRTN